MSHFLGISAMSFAKCHPSGGSTRITGKRQHPRGSPNAKESDDPAAHPRASRVVGSLAVKYEDDARFTRGWQSITVGLKWKEKDT